MKSLHAGGFREIEFENLVHSGQLLVHVLAGTERVAYTDLADYEHRARRSGGLPGVRKNDNGFWPWQN